MTRPRILIITRNLPPLVGGMERLNWHMADELAKQADVYIVGPNGAAAIKPATVGFAPAPLKPLPLFLLLAFFQALWLALRWRPTVVLAGSGLTAPLAWLVGKCCGARTAAYLHGLDITVKHRGYQKLWVPVFKKLDCVLLNSTPTQQLALAAGVAVDKAHIVYPGVSLPTAPQSAERINAFKQQHGLQDKKILLSVGRLTTRKGLCEFVAQALPRIVAEQPTAMLVVVGEAPRNALGAGIQSVASIQAAAAQAGVGQHVLFLGVVTDATQLATVYEAADVHVFPVRHLPDDPEGFGMVAIEAAAHGLPTAAFATGGIVDAVAHGQSGYLAEKNNYQALSAHTLQLLQAPLPPTEIRHFAQGFAWEQFGQAICTALGL